MPMAQTTEDLLQGYEPFDASAFEQEPVALEPRESSLADANDNDTGSSVPTAAV